MRTTIDAKGSHPLRLACQSNDAVATADLLVHPQGRTHSRGAAADASRVSITSFPFQRIMVQGGGDTHRPPAPVSTNRWTRWATIPRAVLPPTNAGVNSGLLTCQSDDHAGTAWARWWPSPHLPVELQGPVLEEAWAVHQEPSRPPARGRGPERAVRCCSATGRRRRAGRRR